MTNTKQSFPSSNMVSKILVQSLSDKNTEVVKIKKLGNGFWDNHVYSIETKQEKHVLKFPHDTRNSNLRAERFCLEFLDNQIIKAPRLINYGNISDERNPEKELEYLLISHVSGTPLNWLYYEAPKEERRKMLRPCLEFLSQITSYKVGNSKIGSIAGNINLENKKIVCNQLTQSIHNDLGPFKNVKERLTKNCDYYLHSLVDSGKFPELHKKLVKIRQVLKEDTLTSVTLAFCHADIAPMNILVDKESYNITAILDWEFSCINSIDTDFHAFLYFDRYRNWKWCGSEDVEMIRELMEEMEIKIPEGYEERLPWYNFLSVVSELNSLKEENLNSTDNGKVVLNKIQDLETLL